MFINADGITGVYGELLSHNMFTYCKNNPVNNYDPSGYVTRNVDEDGITDLEYQWAGLLKFKGPPGALARSEFQKKHPEMFAANESTAEKKPVQTEKSNIQTYSGYASKGITVTSVLVSGGGTFIKKAAVLASDGASAGFNVVGGTVSEVNTLSDNSLDGNGKLMMTGYNMAATGGGLVLLACTTGPAGWIACGVYGIVTFIGGNELQGYLEDNH